MASHTVALVPGDGIGPETSAAMQRVVEASGADIVWDVAEAGAHLVEEHGTDVYKRQVAARTTEGGTGHAAVRAQLALAKDALAADEASLAG